MSGILLQVQIFLVLSQTKILDMKLLITTLSLLVFTFTATAQQNEVYEYLTIAHWGHNLKIGYGDGEFEEINIKEERTRDATDHRPLLKRISDFEKEGWELFSTEFIYPSSGLDIIMYAVMRKEI